MTRRSASHCGPVPGPHSPSVPVPVAQLNGSSVMYAVRGLLSLTSDS